MPSYRNNLRAKFPYFSLKFWKGLFLEKKKSLWLKNVGVPFIFTAHEEKGAEAEILVCSINMMKTTLQQTDLDATAQIYSRV